MKVIDDPELLRLLEKDGSFTKTVWIHTIPQAIPPSLEVEEGCLFVYDVAILNGIRGKRRIWSKEIICYTKDFYPELWI